MIYSLKEISLSTGLTEDNILHFIEEEWIIPYSPEPCTFDEEDKARLCLIKDLLDEMEVNDEAVPIILNLIDQIHQLHFKIRKFSSKVSTED